MKRDMVFLPKTRAVYASKVRRKIYELTEVTEKAPLMTTLILFDHQLIEWPSYLLQNNTGHDNYGQQSEGRGVRKHNGPAEGVNHFSPSSFCSRPKTPSISH